MLYLIVLACWRSGHGATIYQSCKAATCCCKLLFYLTDSLCNNFVEMPLGFMSTFSKRIGILLQVATPGRLMDHLSNTKGFSLRTLKFLVGIIFVMSSVQLFL